MVYRCFQSSFVIPSGFEPETHSLEGCCSIQLSYGTPFPAIRMQRYKKIGELTNVSEKIFVILQRIINRNEIIYFITAYN